MSFQSFLLNQYAKWKLKDVPEAQREQMTALVSKDPQLFKQIGEEIERRKKGGESEMKAAMEVMKKYRAELAALMPVKAAADMSKYLLCPMPGLVVSVNVEEGQDVKAGEALAVVEAMKMENVLTAERDAKVKKVNAKKGDSLALDDVILEFA